MATNNERGKPKSPLIDSRVLTEFSNSVVTSSSSSPSRRKPRSGSIDEDISASASPVPRRVLSSGAAAPPPTIPRKGSFWKRLSGGGSSNNSVETSVSSTSASAIGNGTITDLTQLAQQKVPPTLEDTLANSLLCLAFWRFLEQSRAAENILILLEISRLESIEGSSNPEVFINHAKVIYKRYIAEETEKQVNVSADSRLKLQKVLFCDEEKDLNIVSENAMELFEGIRTQIIGMIEPVLYNQWITTAEWKFYKFSRVSDTQPQFETVLRTPKLLKSFKQHVQEFSKSTDLNSRAVEFLEESEEYMEKRLMLSDGVEHAKKLLAKFESVLPFIDSLANPLANLKEARQTLFVKLKEFLAGWLETKAELWRQRKLHPRSRTLDTSPPSLCTVLETQELLVLFQNFLENSGDQKSVALLNFLREAVTFSRSFNGGTESPTDCRRMKNESQRIATTYLTPAQNCEIIQIPPSVKQSVLATVGIANEQQRPISPTPTQALSKVFHHSIFHVVQTLESGYFRDFTETLCWVNVDFDQHLGRALETDLELHRLY